MAAIRREREGRLLVLRFDKARANAIDPPFVEELIQAAGEARADDSAALLLASSHPKVFCPGLDLVTLLDFDRLAMRGFMLRFAEAVWALYALPKPVVAAVNGHAVAGGCILALTADWRVARRGAQIGLNEVKIGVPLPWSVALLLRGAAPPAALSGVALLGRNFEGEQALRAGLADELADADGFEAACRARLEEFADKDAYAFATTKRYLRESSLREMRAREAELIEEFLEGWFHTETRARIRKTVESLSKKE
jgi:enoyl-CoA hydratase